MKPSPVLYPAEMIARGRCRRGRRSPPRGRGRRGWRRPSDPGCSRGPPTGCRTSARVPGRSYGRGHVLAGEALGVHPAGDLQPRLFDRRGGIDRRTAPGEPARVSGRSLGFASKWFHPESTHPRVKSFRSSGRTHADQRLASEIASLWCGRNQSGNVTRSVHKRLAHAEGGGHQLPQLALEAPHELFHVRLGALDRRKRLNLGDQLGTSAAWMKSPPCRVFRSRPAIGKGHRSLPA